MEFKGSIEFWVVEVTSHVSSYLCIPDVHAFVKRATGQMPTVWAESHAVDRLLVFSQRMDTDASLHVPKTNCGVKRCTVETGDKDMGLLLSRNLQQATGLNACQGLRFYDQISIQVEKKHKKRLVT